MKSNHSIWRNAKTGGRVLALLLASAMCASLVAPFGVGTSGVFTVGASEKSDPEMDISIGDSFPVIDTETLLQVLHEVQESGKGFKIGLSSAKSSVPVGETVNIYMEFGFGASSAAKMENSADSVGWPQFQYDEDDERSINPIINKLTNIEIAVALPDEMEFAGKNTSKMWEDDETGEIHVKLGDADNVLYFKKDIPVRFTSNGRIPAGNPVKITAKASADMEIVRQYIGENYNVIGQTEEFSFRQANLDIAGETEIAPFAAEDWGVAKANKEGSPVPNGDKITFQFNTGFGAKEGGDSGKDTLVSNPEADIYKRYGRLFIDDLKVVESFQFYVAKDEPGDTSGYLEVTEKQLAEGLLPEITHQYIPIANIPQNEPKPEEFAVAPGWSSEYGFYRYGTNSFFRKIKLDNVGDNSPTYTNYDVNLTFTQDQLRKIAESVLGGSYSFRFKVVSLAGFACAFVGGSESTDSAEASQEYSLSKEGGSIVVRQFYSTSYQQNIPEEPGNSTVWNTYQKENAPSTQPKLNGEFTFELWKKENGSYVKVENAVPRTGSDSKGTTYTYEGLSAGEYKIIETAGGFEGYTDTQIDQGKGENGKPVKNAEITNANSVNANFFAVPVPQYALKIAKRSETGGTLDMAMVRSVWFAVYPQSAENALSTVEGVLNGPILNPASLQSPWKTAPVGTNHYASFTGLPKGKYYVIELPNANYVKNTAVYEADLTDGSLTHMGVYDPEKDKIIGSNSESNYIVNISLTGSIKVQKKVVGLVVDWETRHQHYKPNITNASWGTFTFGLYNEKKEPVTNSSGKQVTATNASEGVLTFSSLQPGIYFIKELSSNAPEKWSLNPDFVGPFVVESGTVTEKIENASEPCTILNYPKNGFIMLRKYDDAGNVVKEEGKIGFTVIDSQGNQLKFISMNPQVGYYQADAKGSNYKVWIGRDGFISIDGLVPGETYTFTEVVKDGVSYEPGESFQLVAQSLGNADDFAAAKGYAQSVKEGALNNVINKKLNTWDIYKRAFYQGAQSNTPVLAGAAVHFYTKSGEGYVPFEVNGTHVSAVSNGSGKFIFTPNGAQSKFAANTQYYILETTFPDGFDVPDSGSWGAQQSKLLEKNYTVGNLTGALYGPFKPTAITTIYNVPGVRFGGSVVKKDGKGSPLPGAYFTVTYQGQVLDGVYLKDGKTPVPFENKNGQKAFITSSSATKFWVMPPEGVAEEEFKVTITEIEAPKGYLLESEPQELTLKECVGSSFTGEVGGPAEFTNFKQASIKMTKYRGNVLSGKTSYRMKASFNIYESKDDGANWTKFGSVTVKATGEQKIEKLNPKNTYAIVETSVTGDFNGITAGGQTITGSTEINGEKAYVIPKDLLKNGETLAVNGYNTMPVAIQVRKLDYQEKKVSANAMKTAQFDLYRLKEGAEIPQTLDDSILERFDKLSPDTYLTTTFEGGAKFTNLQKPEGRDTDTYLVVETSPPDGYLLDPDIYGDSFYSDTRTLVTVDFSTGKELFAAEKPLKNKNAKDAQIPGDETGSVGIRYTQPETALSVPLQELGTEGTNVVFEVSNSTSTGTNVNEQNLIPLYDFTIDNVGLQKFYDPSGKDVSEAQYVLTRITIPAATAAQGKEKVPFAVYHGETLLGESQGEELVLDEAKLQGAQSVRVVYGAETEGRGRKAGAFFWAPAITVEARIGSLQNPNTIVRKIGTEAKLRFDYYRDAAMTMKTAVTPPDAKASIAVPESSAKPKVHISKTVSQTPEGGGNSFVAADGDTVYYTITASVAGEPLENAVLVDVMPPHVELDESSVSVSAAGSNRTVPTSEAGTRNATKALIVELSEPIPAGGTLSVTYSAKVRQDASKFGPTAANKVYLTSNKPLIAPTVQNPTGQTFMNDNGKSPVVQTAVTNLWGGKDSNLGYIDSNANFSLASGSLDILYKWVKGGLDDGFKIKEQMGFTTSGGDVLYKFTYTNVSDKSLTNVRIGDLLPHPGDGRGSQWAPVLDGAGCVTASSSSGGISGVKQVYVTDGTINDSGLQSALEGTSYTSWAKLSDTNAEGAQALAVEFDGELKPKEMLTVLIDMHAPAMSLEESNMVAYNSGRITSDEIVKTGTLFKSYASDPVKVTTSSSFQLGDKVWFDENRNGIQDGSEPGVGGVLVTLHQYINGSLHPDLDRTAATNSDGTYEFDKISTYGDGKISYSLEFSNIPDSMSITQRGAGGSHTNDSDPDPLTGETGQFRFDFHKGALGSQITASYIRGEGKQHVFPAAEAQDMSFDCGLILERSVPVSITKRIDGNPIQGFDNQDEFTFEISQLTGNGETLMGTATVSSGNTNAQFAGTDGRPLSLNVGKYRIRETIRYFDSAHPVERYTLELTGSAGLKPDQDGSYLFEVTNTSEQKFEFTAVNHLKMGKLTISKAFVKGQKPVNAADAFQFTLYRKTGEQQYTAISNASMKYGEMYTFENLPVGDYVIEEKGASGYRTVGWVDSNDLNGASYANPLPITITAQGQELKYTAVNQVVTGKMVLTKNLTGAVTSADRAAQFAFDIYQASGAQGSYDIGSKLTTVTVQGGSSSGLDLPPGTYAVSEQARSGYSFQGFSGSSGGEAVSIRGADYYVFRITDGEEQGVRIHATNRTSTPPPPNPPNPPTPPPAPPTEIPTETPPTTSPETPIPFSTEEPAYFEPDTLVNIPDEPVPLAQNPLVNIEDEPVPLGLPYLGGFTPAHLIPLGGLFILAGWLLIRRKKPESQQKK